MLKLLQLSLLAIAISSCSTHPYIVMNKGVAGNATADLLKRVRRDVLPSEPDLVIILAGTNDLVNSHKFVSYREFRSRYDSIVRILLKEDIQVLLMTIPPVDTTYLFQRHDRTAFDTAPNAKIDSANTMIAGIASAHGLAIVDINQLFRERNSPGPGVTSLVLNAANSGREDGVHPTSEGYELIAREVYAVMKEKGLLKKAHSIVCFGDSITYGAFMAGAGTSEGDTYPAALKRIIEKNR